jgi:quercetin dioxygenase-like cupin family protein
MSETPSFSKGETLVIQPGQEESHWQPVPANGHISILLSPDKVNMQFPFGMGTQTLPPGGFVREHAHVAQEEAFFFLSGSGKAIVDGVEHKCIPGTAIFLGMHVWHKFINEGEEPMSWMWLLIPNGLESFFRAIGRPRTPGAPDPTPYPRPADVLDIEKRWGFAPPRAAAG